MTNSGNVSIGERALGYVYGALLAVAAWFAVRKIRRNRRKEQKKIERAKRRSEEIDDWSELVSDE